MRFIRSLLAALVLGAALPALPMSRDEVLDLQRKVARGDAGAWSTLLAEAERGAAAAQLAVGELHMLGKGVPRDSKLAFSWFERAAEGGNARAQAVLGMAFMSGFEIDKDVVKGARWLSEAARQGEADAENFLAGAYELGIGVRQDKVEATRLLRSAAGKSYAPAQAKLAALMLKGTVEGSPKEALALLEQAAARGNRDAHVQLAELHEFGTHVNQDRAAACRHYLAASDAGHLVSTFRASACVLSDQPTAQEKARAHSLLRRAVELGSREAKNLLEKHPNWPDQSSAPALGPQQPR